MNREEVEMRGGLKASPGLVLYQRAFALQFIKGTKSNVVCLERNIIRKNFFRLIFYQKNA